MAKLGYDKYYRLSGWVHESNAANSKLYYRIDGGSVLNIDYDPQLKSGDWYLVNHAFLIPASANSIEVGCLNTHASTPAYFDDFRLQPLDAGMTCYVYDEEGKIEFVLDNDNLYTRYEYEEETGKLESSYVQVIEPVNHERKIMTKTYNYSGQWGLN